MDDPVLVIQADLLTFLAVTALVLVAAVLAGVIGRAQSMRQVRRFERLVTRAVTDVLDRQCQHGHPPPGQPDPSDEGQHNNEAAPARDGAGGGRDAALSSTGRICNWLVVVCLFGLVGGLVGGSEHLVWASGLGLLLVPLAAAPWLSHRQRTRGQTPYPRGWSSFDSWWRALGIGR